MHARIATGFTLLSLPLLLASGAGQAGAQEAQEAQVFHACYVPLSGTIYRIKDADMRPACSSPGHVEFSWADGAGALRAGDETGGDLSGVLANPRVVALLGRTLSSTPPADGQVLTWDEASSQWVPRTPADGVSHHGDLTGLDGDDHPQYLRSDGTRPLAADLDAAGHRIRAVASAAGAGEVLVYGQAAGGDLDGALPGPLVAALRGRPVEDIPPVPGQVLGWNGTHWTPTSPAPGGTIASPNGQYSLSVTDAGIVFQGPSATIRMDGAGIEVVTSGHGDVLLQADGGLSMVSSTKALQLQSPVSIGLDGTRIELNGACSPIAKVGSAVVVAGSTGTVADGSISVLGC